MEMKIQKEIYSYVKKIWDATDINEDKQMAQFGATFRRRTLTWLLNYTKNKNPSK